MAIVSVQNLGGRGGSFTTIDSSTQTLRYLVKCDTRYETADSVKTGGILAGGLPIPMVTVIAGFPPMRCVGLDAKQEPDSPLHWIVDAKYSSAPISVAQQEREEVPDPTDRRAHIEAFTVQRQKAVYKDRDGKAVANSAGDYFDPPSLKDISNILVSVRKNITVVNFNLEVLNNSVNDATLDIRGPGWSVTAAQGEARFTLRRLGMRQVENEVAFLPLEFDLEIQRGGWGEQRLDEGLRYKDGEVRRNIKDASGENISAPVPLNGAGAVVVDPTPENAAFRPFNFQDEEDFSVLPGLQDW